jgi:hypothetical protein
MAADVKRAYDLYGKPVGTVWGKMMKRKVGWAIYDDDLITNEKKQVLHTDVMHLEGQRFLIAVCEQVQ